MDKDMGIDIEDLTEEKKPDGSGWMNFFLVRRRNNRGDLVGSIALWAFFAIIFCVVLGGSSFRTESILIEIPKIDWKVITGLLTPIVAHTIKGSVESVNGK